MSSFSADTVMSKLLDIEKRIGALSDRISTIEERMTAIGNNTDMGSLDGSSTLAQTISYCNSARGRLNAIYSDARTTWP